MKANVLVLLGACAGGVLGYFVFAWLAGQGYYGLAVPGALLGLGAGIFRGRSTAICAVCGLLALALGVFTEWRFAPFVKDGSLGYFLAHLHQLKPMTLVMIVVGAAIGFWVPFRRRNPAAKQDHEPSLR